MSKQFGALYTRPWFTHPMRRQAIGLVAPQAVFLSMLMLAATDLFRQWPKPGAWLMLTVGLGSLVHVVRRCRATHTTRS